MKRNFIFIFLGMFLLVLLAGLGKAEVTDLISYNTSSDISQMIGEDLGEGTVFVEKINYQKEDGISTLSFQKTPFERPNGNIKIGENDFTNIASTDKVESYIKVNEDGEIVEANLRIAKANQEMVIDNKKFTAPPGSTVVYKDGQLKVILPKYSTNNPTRFGMIDYRGGNDIVLEGSEFLIRDSSGNDVLFSHSERVHFDGTNYFVKSGEKIAYEGISLDAKDRINLFFDGKLHEGNSLSFGEKSFVWSCGENPNVGDLVISGDSKYYNLKDLDNRYYSSKHLHDSQDLNQRRLGERKLVVSLTDPNTNIDFFGKSNPMDPNIPTITCSGGYVVDTGRVELVSQEGKVRYMRDIDGPVQSREIIISDSSNDKYQKFIQIGENSNLRAGVHSKDVPWENNPLTYESMNHFNLYLFSDNPEMFGTYEFGRDFDLEKEFIEKRNYLVGAQDVLNDALIKKYPALSNYETDMGSVHIRDLDSMVKEVGTDYFLTSDEIRRALLGTGYENYASVAESVKEMVPYYETSGTTEGIVSSLDELYGVRQFLIQRFLNSNDPEVQKMFFEAKEKVLGKNRNAEFENRPSSIFD